MKYKHKWEYVDNMLERRGGTLHVKFICQKCKKYKYERFEELI